MSLGSSALGCPGSGNILFHRRWVFFLEEPTASLRGDHELQPQSQARSARNLVLSLKYVSYSTFFPIPRLNHTVSAGLWVLLVAAVSLTSQLPTLIIFCVLYCEHQIMYGISLSYFLCFPEASVSGSKPGPLRPVAAVCRILCSNVRGLAGNLSDPIVYSSKYAILLCSKTLVSDMRHVSELLVPGFSLVVSRQDTSGSRNGCIRTRWLLSISPTQIWVWLLRNAGFGGLWCETEPLCVQTLSQPLLRETDFWLFTSIQCRLRMSVPLSYLWVIWMTIVRSGRVLQQRTVMELQHLTSQRCLVAISWLSAQPMHVGEHFTS